MQLKFQYNKTELTRLKKQLQIRQRALPTLKSKEAALRVEVKKVSDKIQTLKNELAGEIEKQKKIDKFWTEFPLDLISIKTASITLKRIAGVKVPILGDIEFDIKKYSLFAREAWFPFGIDILKNLLRITLEIEVANRQFDVLSYARKKTTQKVNLYEKVQIPAYKEAQRMIKRFLEDQENLMKSSQKIVKARNSAKEAQL